MHFLSTIYSYTFQPYIFLYWNPCTPLLRQCTIVPPCTAECLVYCQQIFDICNSIYIPPLSLYTTHSQFSCRTISVRLFYRYFL